MLNKGQGREVVHCRGLRVALVVLVLGTASVAGADYKEIYVEGVEAFKGQSWRDLARLMQGAINENPREKRSGIRTGMFYVDYVPHYYLGVARAELGSCDRALAAWRAAPLMAFSRRCSSTACSNIR